MRERLRSHLTYANVISTLCLFLILGGGSAVALSGTNTVQSDDLGPGAQVKAADVADNAVNGTDIVNGQVKAGDLANNAVTSAKIANGQVKRGDLDPTAITTGITRVVAASPNDTTGIKEVTATCPPGKKVTGGGFVLGGSDPHVYRSYAVDDNSWLVRAIDNGSVAWQVTVTAVCAG